MDEYRIECRDSPDGYWYILGTSHTMADAEHHAGRYRRLLHANGCDIRVRPAPATGDRLASGAHR